MDPRYSAFQRIPPLWSLQCGQTNLAYSERQGNRDVPFVRSQAATLLIVTFRSLGTNITDTVVTRARHTLVTDGPYRWVRHPFYVAFALAMAADSLVTANWFLALTGALAVALIAIRTRTEEEKLIERFGDQYRHYMERTGRFIPRLKK